MKKRIIRAWSALAPKLVAFLATGLTTSGLIYAGTLVGLEISAELAVILVGGISSVAAFIQSDPRLAQLGPGQFSLKVVTFIVTSASAATVVALLAEFGIDLSAHSALIGAGLTILAALLGYAKSDARAAVIR